jgi:hypothetical protein
LKAELINIEQAAGRLLAEWAALAEYERQSGLIWYEAARQQIGLLAITYDLPFPAVAAVAAALSVRSTWQQTIGNTDRLLYAEKKGSRAALSTYKRQKDLAVSIMRSYGSRPAASFYSSPGSLAELAALLGYRKTYNFFYCLLYPGSPEFCPLDRHLIRAALPDLAAAVGNEAELTNTKRKHDRLLLAVKRAAARIKISPSALQAAIWQNRARSESITASL